MVWADADGDGAFDNGETVLRYSRGNRNLNVAVAPAGTISFDARGRRRGANNQVLTLRPADCGGQPLLRTLTINASGQVQTARGDCL